MPKPVLTFLVLLLLSLAACTTTAAIQRDCGLLTDNFAAEVACITEAVNLEPGLRDDSFVREYLLSGQVLAGRLASGEISEQEARLQFARSYNRLVLQQKQYSAYSALEHNAFGFHSFSCFESGRYIYCNRF